MNIRQHGAEAARVGKIGVVHHLDYLIRRFHGGLIGRHRVQAASRA
jgi:hypothetical protein